MPLTPTPRKLSEPGGIYFHNWEMLDMHLKSLATSANQLRELGL